MEVTSSTAQAKMAEVTAMKITNFLAVRLLMRRIKLTIQAKNPASFRRPIKTIIPTRKRITSREANSITLLRSMVRVNKRIEVPKKTNPKRKSQKKRVPKMEAENMAIAV